MTAAQSSVPEESTQVDLYTEACAAHAAGQLGVAEAIYRQVLRQQPTHADGQHKLGALLVQTHAAPGADHGETSRLLLSSAFVHLRAAIHARPGCARFRHTLGGGTTALVFGREESGLTEEELRLVSHACAIPSGRLQPSLNLSHAASAVLSECFQRRSYVTSPPSPQSESPHSSSGQQPQPQPQLPGSSAAPAQAGDLDAQQQREQQQEQQQQQQQPFWLGAGAAAPPGSALLGGAQTEGRAGVGAAPGDGGGAGAGSGGGGATSGGPPPVEYATAREVEVLLSKLATVAGAAGANVDESRKASEAHARTRLPLGHVRAVLARAKLTLTEVRSLHGLASSVIDALIPGHLQGTRRRGKKSEREKGE